MLMGAAQLSIKSVVKNLDDYLLQPLGEALFAFNMQFDFDPEARGDLEVKARGTESLMKNEVRSQRLLQLLQIGNNPAVAPYLKIPVILRELGAAMDLDSEKLINDEREAFVQAEIIKAAGGIKDDDGGEQGGAQGINAADPSGGGGGNIGVGQAPAPGEQGFSAPKTQAEPQAAQGLEQLLGGAQ
jgi:hypothetical protein